MRSKSGASNSYVPVRLHCPSHTHERFHLLHEHVAECVVLFVDSKDGGIWNLGVLRDGDPEFSKIGLRLCNRTSVVKLTSFPRQVRETTQKQLEHSSSRAHDNL